MKKSISTLGELKITSFQKSEIIDSLALLNPDLINKGRKDGKVKVVVTDKNGHRRTVWKNASDVKKQPKKQKKYNTHGKRHVEYHHEDSGAKYKQGDKVKLTVKGKEIEGTFRHVNINNHSPKGYAVIRGSDGKLYERALGKISKHSGEKTPKPTPSVEKEKKVAEKPQKLSAGVKKVLKLLDKENELYEKLGGWGHFGEMSVKELDDTPKGWRMPFHSDVRKLVKQRDKVQQQIEDSADSITKEEYEDHIEHITMYSAEEWNEDWAEEEEEDESSAEKVISELIAKTEEESEKIHGGDVKGYENHVYKDQENWRGGKSTEELKNEVGAYISTEILYGRDNVSFPENVEFYMKDLGKANVDKLINSNETEKIDIEKINIIQRHVFEKPLKQAIEKEDTKVVLFKSGGEFYLNDGNHRVAGAKIKGLKQIDAVIVDVDKEPSLKDVKLEPFKGNKNMMSTEETEDLLSEMSEILGTELNIDSVLDSLFSGLRGNVLIGVDDEGELRCNYNGKDAHIERILQVVEGELVCYNLSFGVSKLGTGKGTDIFKNQVIGMHQLGVSKMECDADGNGLHKDGNNGYYTWGRLGYKPVDGFDRISEDIEKNLETMGKKTMEKMTPLLESESLVELLSTSEGKTLMKDYGKKWTGEFDLSEDSDSMIIFEEYLKSKGKTLK